MKEHSDIAVSASPDAPQHWHDVDWQRVQRNVRGMQFRIAKASRECNWRKVKALQRMLTRSRSAKLLAVRRVTENHGKKTAGVDGVLWSTPEAKWNAAHCLKRRGYKPMPLRRVFIPKSGGRQRPLGIPTLTDRAQQALYLLALAPIAETVGDPNSYGFRINRSTADAMSQLFNVLANKNRAKWILEADVESCFDKFNHEWLIDNVPMDKSILRKWLKAGVVYRHQWEPTEEGTPQGGIISPTLANWALDGLEKQLHSHLHAKLVWNVAKAMKINVVRYADDFVITGASKEVLENEIKPWVEMFLSQRGLRLSPQKTAITHIDQGFDFLGWNFRKYKGKLLIKPSVKNAKAFYREVREIIRSNRTVTQETLIELLNPKIRGWAQYHAPVVAKDVFNRMDNQIFWAIWRWAERRHPAKRFAWVKRRYYRPIGNRKGVFAAISRNDYGDEKVKALFAAASVPIERHIKISGDFNPFDPSKEAACEKVRMERMKKKLRYRRQINALFASQQGSCVLCRTPITWETGWDDHHIVYRSMGGTDALENRVLLHPMCHQQVHGRKLSVSKPAPGRGFAKA